MPKLRQNCAEKRDTPATQNWPQREAPRPILRAACGRVFPRNFGVLSAYFSTKSCKDLSIYRKTIALGAFPSSGTAILTDLLKKYPKKVVEVAQFYKWDQKRRNGEMEKTL